MHLEGKNFIYVFLSAFLGTIVPNGIFAQGDESLDNQHFKTFIASDPISNSLAFYDVTSSTTQAGGQSFFLKNASVSSRKNDITDLSTLGLIYIQNLKAELAITSNANDFIEQNLKLSNYGSSHISYTQSLNSIPVFGAEIMVHFDAGGQLRGMNGLAYSLKATSKTSNINLADAINNAVNHINGLTKAVYLNNIQKKILQYNGPTAQLFYYPNNNKLELCWLVDYCPNFQETWQAFVSAETGELIKVVEQTCYLDGPKTSKKSVNLNNEEVSLGSYKVGDKFYLLDASKSMFKPLESILPEDPKGVIKTYNADKLTRDNLENAELLSAAQNIFGTTSAEKAVVSAQYNASLFYDKLSKSPYNYNSYDNAGSNITMYTNMHDPIKPFIGWENASWNGRVAFFGKGYNLYKAPLSKALDVVSHELTHGLIEHSTNLNKAASNQTAALIEAICDIMGMVVDGNYTIGENADVNKTYRASGLVRNPQMPHNGQSNTGNWGANQSNGYTSDHLKEFVNNTEAAHYNSTIISHAFYLMSGKAGSLGLQVASELFFDVVTNYLGSSSNFYDFKDALLLAVDIRFGAGNNYYDIIKEAFSAVGLETVQKEVKADDLPALIGDNFIISSKVNTENQAILSLFKMADSEEDKDFNAANNLQNDASVTDNGNIIYGITHDNEILQINYGDELQVNSLTSVLGSGYSQVAVSKKNERLALVKQELDTAIHIFDFELGFFKSFPISTKTIVRHENEFYNLTPTRVGSMEWDFYGSKLIFEFENQFVDKNGTQHFVWNIAEIEVWDSLNYDFADGKIHTFYDQISSDLDLRYPSFAKNSPNLFVHDAFDKKKNQNTVVAWDRSGNLAVKTDVVRTKILAHASYTNTDSSLVLTDLDENGEPCLFLIQLKRDKVTLKNGMSPLKILSERKNPKWFTVGLRTSIKPSPSNKNAILVYPNPAHNLLFVSNIENNIQYAIYNNLGQVLQEGKIENSAIEISQLPIGQYILQLQNQNGLSTTTFIKE